MTFVGAGTILSVTTMAREAQKPVPELTVALMKTRLEECLRRRADCARRLQALIDEERALDVLEHHLLQALGPDPTPARRPSGGDPNGEGSFHELIHAYERDLIEQALGACGGVQREAAALLGMLPTTLHEKLRRLGVRPERHSHHANGARRSSG